jgi:outer membrane lipoprotein carrier protein
LLVPWFRTAVMKSHIAKELRKLVTKAIVGGLTLLSLEHSSYAADLSCQNPDSTTKGLVEGVEAAYLKITSISSDFFQTSYFVGLDKREVSKGTVSFARPGKMNWDYLEPDPQRFISDGKTIQFYQPKLNQVTLTSFKEAFSSELPVTFLLGIGSLSKSFTPLGVCKIPEGTLIKLAPKTEDASLSSFLLLVDRTTLSPLGAKVVDLGGNETSIMLVGPKFNAPIPSSTFDFKIPKGVDIIDNRTGNNLNSTQSDSGGINQGPGGNSVEEENLVK